MKPTDHLRHKSIRLMQSRGLFTKLAKAAAWATGQPWAFMAAASAIVVWACCGPFFGFSDTWQLIINTSTTIVTFLMVFLIQSTQNRDGQALQLKLDELIRATDRAHTAMLDLEELTDQELFQIKKAYRILATKGRENIREGQPDTGTPDVVFTETFGRKPSE
jgi:low affinity Fe/Cu permease